MTKKDDELTHDRRLSSLEGAFDLLVDMLEGKEIINKGNRKLLSKVSERSERAGRRAVRLNMAPEDKFEVKGPDIDCAALFPICRARCCKLNVELSVQDVEEGELRWQLWEPYLLEKADDGHCSYLGADGGCTTYHNRPLACRAFDCRGDRRIWRDFENKIPAPMGLLRPYEPSTS